MSTSVNSSSDVVISRQVKGSRDSSSTTTDSKEASLQILSLMTNVLHDIQSDEDTVGKVNGASEDTHLTEMDLQNVLALVASLSALIQEWESHFESQKGSIDADIGSQFIASAKAALDKIDEQIKKADEARRNASIFDIILDVVECVVGAILLLVPGCEAFGAMMLVMFVVDKSGLTAKLAEGLKKLGLSDMAANIVAGVILAVASSVGTCGAGLAMRAMTSTGKIAEAAAKEAVKTTIREVVAQAVKTAVQELGTGATKEALGAAVKEAVERVVLRDAVELAGKWGVDVVESGLKKGIADGVKEGMKEAGIKLASKVLERIASETYETVSTVIKEITGVAFKFVHEEVETIAKEELDGFIEKFKKNQLKQIVKVGLNAGVTGLSSTLISSGAMTQIAEEIAKKSGIKGLAKTLLIVLFNLIAVVATAGAAIKGPTAIDGVGRSVSNNTSSMLHRLVTWSQRIGQGFDIGIGGAKVDNAFTMFDVNTKVATEQSKSTLYNSLANFQNEMMKMNQKQFDEMQRAVPAIMQDAQSIAQELAAAAQELA